MVSSIVPSFLQALPEIHLSAFTPSQTRAQALLEQVGGTLVTELTDLSAFDGILLGFKPQQFQAVAGQLQGKLKKGQLVISLLAGTSVEQIEESLGTDQVVRLMPNTPAQVGAGASLMAFSHSLSAPHKKMCLQLLDSLGVGVEVDEAMLNTATPYSGSGPAYYFLLTELLIEDLKSRGMQAEQARLLCEQTFIGAAELLKQSDQNVQTLRANVTSKGGVTHAAVESMLSAGLADTIHQAIDSALKRNQELSQ